MNEETIFTKIIKREIPSNIIYEDDKHLAFLDIMPFEKGHTLVIPKKSYKTMFEMPEEEFLSLMKVVYKIANHYEKTLNCGINIWQNNKRVAGQEINHVHVHIVPRLQNKKTYILENGERYVEGEASKYCEKLKLN